MKVYDYVGICQLSQFCQSLDKHHGATAMFEPLHREGSSREKHLPGTCTFTAEESMEQDKAEDNALWAPRRQIFS